MEGGHYVTAYGAYNEVKGGGAGAGSVGGREGWGLHHHSLWYFLFSILLKKGVNAGPKW